MRPSVNFIRMDTQPQQPVPPQVLYCQCPSCRRRGWGFFRAIFRFLGLLILVVVVFVLGLLLGGFGPAGVAPFGQNVFWDDADSVRPGMMMLKSGEKAIRFNIGGDESVFGVVTAVKDQSITIADNGGGTQSVVVSADTHVFDGEREVAVWTLRIGNSLRVFGAEEGSVIEADVIEVVR